jgi:hypothetical protein
MANPIGIFDPSLSTKEWFGDLTIERWFDDDLVSVASGNLYNVAVTSVSTVVATIARVSTYARAVTAVGASATTIVKQQLRTLLTTKASTATLALAKQLFRTITSTEGSVATVARVLARGIVLTSGASVVVALLKQFGLTLPSTSTIIATLTKGGQTFFKELTSNTTVTATLVRLLNVATLFLNPRFYLLGAARVRGALRAAFRASIGKRRI